MAKKRREASMESETMNVAAAPVGSGSGAAIAEMDASVIEGPPINAMEEEEESVFQVDGSDNNAEPDEPDQPAASEPVQTAITSKFRQFCTEYPDHVHAFKLDELIIDHKRNGRVQPRDINDADIKEMEQSIRLEGQLQPGIVTLSLDGKLYVTAGTGRYLGIQRIANTDKVSCVFKALVTVETAKDPIKSRVQNAMENLYRKPLTVSDRAEIVKSLMEDEGLTQAQVQARLGIKSKATVSQLRKIADFPQSVKDAIAEDKIGARAAYELSVMTDPGKLEKAAATLIANSDGHVTKTAVGKTRKGKDDTPDEASDGKRKRKGKVQRTPKAILDFIESEAVPATAAKYKDKNLPAKLECFGAYVKGGTEKKFLTDLAAL